MGGYPHLVRCGGRGSRAEFRFVGVYDTLRDGEDIDGIGVGSRNRLYSGLKDLDLDFDVALRSHRQCGISIVTAKFPGPAVLIFSAAGGRYIQSNRAMDQHKAPSPKPW